MRTPISVLLVEDDDATAEFIRARLSPRHFVIRHASSLTEAMALALHRPPDVVLLDLTLPDSDDLDSVASMVDTVGHVPVLVLTGHTDPLLAIGSVQRGAHDYLLKWDADAENLDKSIRAAVKSRQGLARTPPPQRLGMV